MIKRYLLFSALSALMILLTLAGLIGHPTGSRWLLQSLFSILPGQVTAGTVQGRLLDRISVASFSYRNETKTITANRMTMSWQPSQLFSGVLKISDLTIDGLTINIAQTKPEESETAGRFEDAVLPLQFDLTNLLLTNVHVTSKQQHLVLDKVQLSAKTEANRVRLLSLAIHSDKINASAKGDVVVGKSFPAQLSAEWAIDTGGDGLWQGNTIIGGDLEQLIFENQLISPFKLTLQGRAGNVLTTPLIEAHGDWRDLVWPVAAKPSIVQSRYGHFELAGRLDDYRVKLNGGLEQPYVPQTEFSFRGKGGLSNFAVEQLELNSSSGVLRLAGDIAWGDGPVFDLSATGQHFNPAVFVPELSGSLTFGVGLKGKLISNDWQLAADIQQLTGQLRQQPLNGQGKFALSGGQLKIDTLRLLSGANKLALDGEIDQAKGNLALTMNMPALSTLWPGLGGKLKGKGQIQGGWRHPSVNFDAEGNHIRFAGHGAQDVLLNIDYRPDDRSPSSVNISANAIKSGGASIDKFVIAGKGSLKKHDFTTEINSTKGKMSAALTGALTEGHWHGVLTKLNVIDHTGNLWTLKEAALLRMEKKILGVDFMLSEGCLVRQLSSLCTKGAYLADSDLDFQLIAKAIPSALIQVFLPGQHQVTSAINGNVDLQRRGKAITGRYRLDTTPAQVAIVMKNTRQEISLGASSVAGDISGDKISADVDLKLAGRDYLQAKLVLDAGKRQIRSGNLSASIAEFGLIQPFVPQIQNIKGILKADLGLQGSIQKPLINGHIDFTGGSVDIGRKGSETAGLRNIDLHALAAGNRSGQIQLRGSAMPLMLNKPGTPQKIALNSGIDIEATLKTEANVAGTFRVAMPVSTILLETQELKKEVKLGPAIFSGLIKGKAISGDLDMTLMKQDFLRGTLVFDLGKAQNLSAQITASIQNFAMIESFAPQLSGIKGLLKADMAVNGTLNNPLVTGGFQFDNGALTINKLGANINGITLKAVNGSDSSGIIRLTGSAKSGEGLINLDGAAKLDPEAQFPVELALTGQDFEIAKIPAAQIAVSPDLKIALAGQNRRITGQIDVPKAILKIQDIPENAVQVSEDEIVLGEEKSSGDAAPPPNLSADIEINLGKTVSFSGQGLQTNLSGKLKIVKAGEKLAMQGNVDMANASYKRFGQDLTVRKGRFLFNGPADNPWLDVEAIRLSKSKEVTAILALIGTLKNPQTRVSSEPSLPESEALAYLITGNSLNQVSKAEGNMLASAALSYGAGKAAWLTEKLGIDEFKVEEGSTLQDSLLVMGEYLTPDFYVGTKVGMFNKQANIVLKHNITDTINVETQAGTSQRIKLNYEFDSD